jgi:hypothetical protein
LASFVAQHQQGSDATDEEQEDCQQKDDFEDNFDKLVDSASD